MADKILIRRGLKKDLPLLSEGEFGFCRDTKEVFIGTAQGNILINDKNIINLINDLATNSTTETWSANKINNSLSNKVDKVSGKQLSTEDYTTSEKNKLAGIEMGAEKNKVLSVNGQTGNVIVEAGSGGATINDSSTTSTTQTWSASKINTSLNNKVDKVTGKQLSTEDYTTTEKNKLAGIANNANNYIHPTGDGNSHVPATGTTNNKKVLKAGATANSASWGDVDWSEITGKPSTFTPPTASSSQLGGVKIGSGINVDANGVISVPESPKITVSSTPPTNPSVGDIWIDTSV